MFSLQAACRRQQAAAAAAALILTPLVHSELLALGHRVLRQLSGVNRPELVGGRSRLDLDLRYRRRLAGRLDLRGRRLAGRLDLWRGRLAGL